MPVPPFPSNDEVQSKNAIVFSEMEEHRKSKDVKLEGAHSIEDQIPLNDIEENAQDKIKLFQKDEEEKMHLVKNDKNEESTENRKKDWVHVCARQIPVPPFSK